MNKLTVSSSPHILSGDSTRSIMGSVLLALSPTLLAAAILYGLRAVLLCGVCVGASVLTEHIWCLAAKKPSSVWDLSAAVTGVILSFNLPASLPLWQAVVGSVFAIAVVKQLFGGLGCNFLNPALAARVMMNISFTGSMTAYSFPADAASTATPMAELGELGAKDFLPLLVGYHGGVMGETCALTLLLGGAYLVFKGVIKPHIPLAFIGSTLLFSWLFGSPNALLSIFAGGLMLGAIFMATDYVTSPYSDLGKIVYGLGAGLLTSLIRIYSNSSEGVSFALLIMNLVVPYINDFTRRRPFGEVSAR